LLNKRFNLEGAAMRKGTGAVENKEAGPASSREDLVPRPQSGTRARVTPDAFVPAGPPKPLQIADDIAAIAAESAAAVEIYTDDPTCVNEPLIPVDDAPPVGPRPFLDSDPDSTRAYEELPTRVFVRGESERPPISEMRKSQADTRIEPPSSSAVRPTNPLPLVQPPPLANNDVTRAVPQPSVQVEAAVIVPPIPSPVPPPLADPLAVDRALLRAISAPAPMMVPIVAVRPAPPNKRMLAIVALFTTLGMLWVLAVSAMILSIIIH
jgi:hypothetical protein